MSATPGHADFTQTVSELAGWCVLAARRVDAERGRQIMTAHFRGSACEFRDLIRRARLAEPVSTDDVRVLLRLSLALAKYLRVSMSSRVWPCRRRLRALLSNAA